MADFQVPLEVQFSIKTFNNAADKMSREQAIELLKTVHEQTQTRQAFASFLMSKEFNSSDDPDDEDRGSGRIKTAGLEHISTIIPRVVRVVDCGDFDEISERFDDAS